MKTLSDRMRYALDQSGKTQSALAKACGISVVSVNDWLSGKTKSLKASTALKAAFCLKVDVAWLTTGTGSPEASPDIPAKDISPLAPESFEESGNMKTLGARTLYARKLRGLTQPFVADRSGISKGGISQIENDQIQTVNSEILFPLADCLGVSARWLATGEGDLGAGNDDPRIQAEPLRDEVLKKVAGFSTEKIKAPALLLSITI